jgi:hypothetical protein
MIMMTTMLMATISSSSTVSSHVCLQNEGSFSAASGLLICSQDQFDTVDFSDNDIRKLDGFPLLKRLKCLLLNNNRIV